MLVFIGIGSEIAMVEVVVASILDLVPCLRRQKTIVVVIICVLFFLLALPMCCHGGVDLFVMIDTYATSWNLLIICLFECIALTYIYGLHSDHAFLSDIEFMMGKEGFFRKIFWYVTKYWWALCWFVLTPMTVILLLGFSIATHKPQRGDRPIWANLLFSFIVFSVIIDVFGTMAVRLCLLRGKTFSERLQILTTPSHIWGPVLPEHRKLYNKKISQEKYRRFSMRIT